MVSHYLIIDKMTGKKFLKMRGEKIEKLQKGAWDDERFDREQLYACVQFFLGLAHNECIDCC